MCPKGKTREIERGISILRSSHVFSRCNETRKQTQRQAERDHGGRANRQEREVLQCLMQTQHLFFVGKNDESIVHFAGEEEERGRLQHLVRSLTRRMLLYVSNRGRVGEVGVVPRRNRVQDRVHRTRTCGRWDGLVPLARNVLM